MTKQTTHRVLLTMLALMLHAVMMSFAPSMMHSVAAADPHSHEHTREIVACTDHDVTTRLDTSTVRLLEGVIPNVDWAPRPMAHAVSARSSWSPWVMPARTLRAQLQVFLN